MKHLFITDSNAKKCPNIALMKIATYLKGRGDSYGFNIEKPDHIYVSCVFEKNLQSLLGACRFYPNVPFTVGGSGTNPPVILPAGIEKLPPDYSIYPKYGDSIGYVTAGCPRKCYFCVVPKMGTFRYVQPIWDIYRGDGNIRLIDDNILAMPKAFAETADWLIEHGVRCDFEYLDIRYVYRAVAQRLRDIKNVRRVLYFAYDITNEKTECEIARGVYHLKSVGFRPGALRFLLYVHSQREEDLEDAKKRYVFLRTLGVDVIGMPNRDYVKNTSLRRTLCRLPILRNYDPDDLFRLPHPHA